MRALSVALVVLSVPAVAGDSLWNQLATADTVVVATVKQVDGETAHLGVEQTLKGRAREPLLVSTLVGDHLVAPNLRVGSRAVFVLRGGKAPAAAAGGVTLPKDTSAPPLATRLATVFLQGDDATPVLALVGEALRAQAGGQAMPASWPAKLLRFGATRGAALSLLERDATPSDEARRTAADVVLSGDFDGPYSVVALPRLLAVVGPVREDEVNRAALDILERSMARPENGWRSLERPVLEVLKGRVENAPKSAAADENRRRLVTLTTPH